MNHMEKTATITLDAEQTALVDAAVASGEYTSENAVVAAALREWKERRDNFGYTLGELRHLVQEGIDSGPAEDGPEVFDRLRDRIRRISQP